MGGGAERLPPEQVGLSKGQVTPGREEGVRGEAVHLLLAEVFHMDRSSWSEHAARCPLHACERGGVCLTCTRTCLRAGHTTMHTYLQPALFTEHHILDICFKVIPL